MNDTVSINRLKHGDISGLASLVERYGTQAVRAAYLITHDRDLAEDVVQNAFLRVYQRIEQFDSTRPFKPWFMRMVANAAIRASHQDGTLSSLDAHIGDSTFADLLPDPAPGPETHVELTELRETVWQALEQLSPEQRATVVMRYFLELSDEEISGELDVSPSTVRGRLRAARQRLRGLLKSGSRASRANSWQGGSHE